MENLKDILKKRYLKQQEEHPQATQHQQLAVEIAKEFKEKEKIGWYAKMIKQRGYGLSKQLFEEIKFNDEIENKAAYFVKMMNL